MLKLEFRQDESLFWNFCRWTFTLVLQRSRRLAARVLEACWGILLLIYCLISAEVRSNHMSSCIHEISVAQHQPYWSWHADFKRRQAETSNIDLFILANKCAMDDFKGRVGWVCLLSSVRILVLGNYGISFDVWSSCVNRLHLIWFSWRLHVAAGHFEAEPEAASVRAPVASPGAAASLCFGIKRLILRGNSSLLSLLQIRH